MAVTNSSRLILSIIVMAALSVTVLAAAGDDVIGPRDEAKVGCPKFTTRKPAKDEIQVTTAPMNLDKPGKYILMNDISVKASAFIVTAPNVVFDLNGHTITYGTGVKNVQGKGVKTYTSWRSSWQKKIGRKNDRKVGPVSKNLGHSAIVASRGPGGTQDWPDEMLSWSNATRKGFILKNGRITQGKGEGLAYSPALMLGGASEAKIYNLIVDVSEPDSEALLIGPNSKVYNCTFNDTVTQVSNRHKIMCVVNLGVDSEIYNCLLDGSPQSGVKTKDGGNVHDNIIKMRVTATNGYGVQGYGQDDVKVHHNKIMPYDGRGIHVSEKGSNWDVHHNYVEIRNGPNREYAAGGAMKMTEHGIKLETTSNSKVHDNVVLSISVPGGFPTPLNIDVRPDSNNKVYNNTFVAFDRHNGDAHAVYLINKDGASTTIEDNTFYTNKWSFHYYWGGTSNNTFRRCTFRKLQPSTGEGFVDFGNTKPSVNNVFVDCQFLDGIDPKIAHIRPKEDEDWRGDADYSIAWSFDLAVFNDKKKVAGAVVTVTDAAGQEVAKGKTDKAGKFTADLKEYTVKYAKGAEKTEIIQHGVYTVRISAGEKSGGFRIAPTTPMLVKVNLASAGAIKMRPRRFVEPKERPIDKYWKERIKLAATEENKGTK